MPHVLSCPTCLMLCVLSCFKCLMPYMLWCLVCLVHYLLPCLTCSVSFVLSFFTCLVPYVLSCLTCLVPYVLSCFTCLTHSCTSRVFCLAFSRDACASCRVCSFTPMPHLLQVFQPEHTHIHLMFSSFHVLWLLCSCCLSYLNFLQPELRLIIVICHFYNRNAITMVFCVGDLSPQDLLISLY